MKVWKPPLRCRLLGHRWQVDQHIVQTPPFGIPFPLEICKHCGAAAVNSLFGYRYYAPDAVEEWFAREKAEAEGKLIHLRRDK